MLDFDDEEDFGDQALRRHKDDGPDYDPALSDYGIWLCPHCGLLMEVDPDGAFCGSCNEYYAWPDLQDADEE